MHSTKFTEEYGHTYDFDGPEYDDPKSGNDVSYMLKIYDKEGKNVHTEHISYPSLPEHNKLNADMLAKAEEIIDDIRPKTEEELKIMFNKFREAANTPKTESFKVFFNRSTLKPRRY